MLVIPKKKSFLAILAIVVLSLVLALTVFSSLAGAAQSVVTDVTDGPAGNDATSNRLIVQLDSPALAERNDIKPTKDGALAVNSADAQAYIAQLEAEQAVFVANMQKSLPSARVSSYINESGQSVEAAYQVVFNGVVVDPGATPRDEARRILSRMPGVKAVYLDFAHYPDTYASMPLINAPVLWDFLGGYENAGAGVKVASMDGGLHHAAPMFDGTGFEYPEGWPAGGLGDPNNNNGKIIASRAYFRAWDPPAVGDGNTWPGENGTSHGTHTGSTAAGNRVVADYLGITETVSGVAPGAWLMSYRVFYASVNGNESFFTTEGIAALEDITMDGANVLNNSWGEGPTAVGGEVDPLDQALINTANSGVFVSMSNGNAGPGKGTTDHPSSEYINVAASTTDGTLASGRLNVTAPEPISPSLQGMSYTGADFGAALPVGDLLSYEYVTSLSADSGNVDGCSPWPADTFTGKAAVISRGGCFFGNKVYHAQEAGAEFVVIYNNAGDGLINMGWGCDYAPDCAAADVTITSIFVGQTNGEGMVSWYDDNGDLSELQVDTFAFQAGNTPDLIISFSSRGPAVGNVLKPDIAAPGVNILAQGYAPGATGEARHLGFGQASGTSMASPHVAGSAALIRQIHPDWSNAAIKSALMSTSKYLDMYNDDGTPAQPLDMGAGRLDLMYAADPGVILDPPSLSFGLVVDGSSASMDLMVTSVADAAETYDLSTLYTGAGFAVTETTTLPGFTVTPASITLDPGESALVTVEFDSSASQGVGDNQGYVVMAGDNDHNAHFPVWARVVPEPTDDVLVIDNDGSSSLGAPNYSEYYTETLEAMGVSYDYYDADPNYAQPTTIPEAAVLSKYKAIIYFTGDNYQPDGTFTVSTALTQLDMDRLTEYANGGGKIFAMGQDMSGVLDSDATDSGTFLYNIVFGANWLQDSVTGYLTPTLPVVSANDVPPALNDIVLHIGDGGDGAGNQFYVDEILASPPFIDVGDPYLPEELEAYQPLLKYPGWNNVADGYVAVSHRYQPTLESPGIAYYGRTVYTSFGLEGVNDVGAPITSREELLTKFMNWAMDEPQVEVVDITADYSETAQMAVFEANLTSNISDTVGIAYRFDFGDGTPYSPPSIPSNVFGVGGNVGGHTYEYCGVYNVRAEVTDSWGNIGIGSLEANVTQNCTYSTFLPVITK